MSTSERVMEKVMVAKGYFVKDLETAMVKATKRNSKIPKWKHVSILLNATWRRDISIADIGVMLEQRLHDSSWSVVFKALIVTHILMDQGSGDRLIGYLATQPSILNMSTFRDSSGSRIEQGKNISRYAAYLEEKVHVYRETKRDYCRPASPTKHTSADSYGSIARDAHLPTDVARQMRVAPVNDQLLKELGAVLRQLQVLLRAQFAPDEIDNDVTLAAFRLLLRDLMRLYHIVNEGIINVLQRLGDLPPPVARQGIALFRQLIALSKGVDAFLATARGLAPSTLQMSVPEFRHIPDIADSLEAELDKGGLSLTSSQQQQQQPSQLQRSATQQIKSPSDMRRISIQIAPPSRTDTAPPAFGGQQPPPMAKPPAALIDFFDALEDNTKQMSQAFPSQQQHQQQQQQQAVFDPFAPTFSAHQPHQSSQFPNSTPSSASSGPGSPWQNMNPFANAAPAPLAFDPFASSGARAAASVPMQPTGSTASNPFATLGGTTHRSDSPFMQPSQPAASGAFNPFAAAGTSSSRTSSPSGPSVFGGSSGVGVTANATGNPFAAMSSQQPTGMGIGMHQTGITMMTQQTGMGGMGMQPTGVTMMTQPTGMGVMTQPTGMGMMTQPMSMAMQTTGNPFGTGMQSTAGMGMGTQIQSTGMNPFGGPMGATGMGMGGAGMGTTPASSFGGHSGAMGAGMGMGTSMGVQPSQPAQQQGQAPGSNYVAVSSSSDPFAQFDPFASKPTASATNGATLSGGVKPPGQQQATSSFF